MTPSEDDIRFMREAAESTLEKMRRAGIRLPRPEFPVPITGWSMREKPEPLRCRTQFEFDALYGAKTISGNLGFQIKMVEDDRTPVEKQRDLWAGIAKARKLWHAACREIGICGAVARAATRGTYKSRSRRVARLRSKVWARWQV